MSSSISSHQAPPLASCRPFLALPDVIRERIYFYVLTIDVYPSAPWITPLPPLRRLVLPALPSEPNRDLLVASKSVRKKRRRKIRAFVSIDTERASIVKAAPHPSLAILATCRTILLEAFHVWYKNNTFNFDRSQDLVAFLGSIGRVRANEIRAVRLDIPARDWHDQKAMQALLRLLRLEMVIFVFNDVMFNHTNPNYISDPEIIRNLRGLREVNFVDPPGLKTSLEGSKQVIGPGQKLRTDRLREKMVAKRKRARLAPPMMDLFGRSKTIGHSKNGGTHWKWEDDSAYAPEVDNGTYNSEGPGE
ncbi:MAG: hypothetical protein Q9178_003564 [Gyalolechia marmorata]